MKLQGKLGINEEEYFNIEVALAHKEVVDINNRFISRELYCKALQEERIKEFIKTGMFYIQWGTSDKHYIEPALIIGKIISINTIDNKAIIRVPNHIKEFIDKDEYVLIFNYIGSVKFKDGYSEITGIRIISAGLLPKSRSAYEVEVM